MIDRRAFVKDATVAAIAAALPGRAHARSAGQSDLAPVFALIEKQHDETVRRLQDWIRQPSIAAEDRGVDEGCALTMRMLSEAGFGQVTRIPSDGQPGIFATLDAGAPRTLGLYFMYDVKQVDPAEWTSPPWEAALVDKPGLGKVVMGRGAVNQKGPEATFLAALHAIRGAGRKPPVNLVLVAEGEEEIGSPHFPQIVRRPEVLAALRGAVGIVMPAASQGLDGQVTVTLGAKGIIECELVASGERWGRGPARDTHSGGKAYIDSPVWHLVEALNTLVRDNGNTPAIDGWFEHVRPLTQRELELIAEQARTSSEKEAMEATGVKRWIDDMSWQKAIEKGAAQPTVNIEGMIAGYTGQGGKTILPARASAKLDMRLVPNMTAKDCMAKLRAHLEKRGFGDIEIKFGGAYDPTETPETSNLIRAERATLKRLGIRHAVLPRIAGSYPGYIFTGDPLRKPFNQFGIGTGGRAHAPDEYYIIESNTPKVAGLREVQMAFAEFLYELADG